MKKRYLILAGLLVMTVAAADVVRNRRQRQSLYRQLLRQLLRLPRQLTW